jgi:hypothetical protein
VRFVLRHEELLGADWLAKTRWLGEATLGDFSTRCRWEPTRHAARKQNLPVDVAIPFVIGLLFYGEAVSAPLTHGHMHSTALAAAAVDQDFVALFPSEDPSADTTSGNADGWGDERVGGLGSRAELLC